MNEAETHISGVARVGCLESTWYFGRRARGCVAASRHVDLGTADVELRGATGVVDGQGLNTQQVFAVLDALGDGVLIRVCVWSVSPPRKVILLTNSRQGSRKGGRGAGGGK